MTLLRHASPKYIAFILIATVLIILFSSNHVFQLQFRLPGSNPTKASDPPKTKAEKPIRKAIVAAARATENTSWMNQIGEGYAISNQKNPPKS